MIGNKRSSARICVRCWVGGRVQGVFFRASTRHQALSLGLTGYARNLPDGRVEVLACGAPEAVDQLKAWLKVGPSAARVTGIACEPVQPQIWEGFTTD